MKPTFRERGPSLGCIVMLAYVLIWFGVVGGVVYVLVHFIRKFW